MEVLAPWATPELYVRILTIGRAIIKGASDLALNFLFNVDLLQALQDLPLCL